LDWLYWQASETGLEYALNQDMFDVIHPVFMGFGEVANPKFDWQSGFRAGIGYHIPHDHWDLSLLWTWNEGQGSDSQKSKQEHSPTVLPILIHPNTYNDEAIIACMTASYDALIHLNLVDLDLGRLCKAGKRFFIKPHFGIRTGWINQIHNAVYNDLFDKTGNQVLKHYATHMTNNFWGLGPRGGFEADFSLGYGLSLVGDFSLSLLYGLFKTSYSELITTELNEQATTLVTDNSFRTGKVSTDMELGLKWTRGFAKDRVKLILQGGWEHHMFFSQNQMTRFVDGQNWATFVQNQGDLYFQGWTASFSFLF